MNTLLHAALTYARLGLPVLPVLPIHTPSGNGCSCAERDCDSIGKHPRLRHGLHQATTSPTLIHAWWHRWPHANIAVRTGTLLDVCDIDTADALAHLYQLQAIPPTAPLVRTGSGTWHLWLAPTGHGNRVNILAGVDWRGAGGYCLVPPSLHPSGQHYLWLRPPHGPFPPCNAALQELLRPPTPPTTQPPASSFSYVDAYAQAALDREIHRVRSAPSPRTAHGRKIPGGRNNALNRASFSLGQLAAAGLLDERHIRTELIAAARAAGLPAAEALRTIESGLRAGNRNPRPSLNTTPSPTT